MKEIEIDIWFKEDSFGMQSGTIWFSDNVVYRNENKNFIKGKLTYEVEQKELTITESQFNEAIEKAYSIDTHISFIKLKKILGF